MGCVYQCNPPMYAPKAVTKRTMQHTVVWEAARPQQNTVLDLQKFCEPDASKDCQLIAKDGTAFHCHRVVIAGASLVLRNTVFTGNERREEVTTTVQVPADSNVLVLLLQFMYGKTVKVPVTDVMAVYSLTEQYQIAAGSKLCHIVCDEIEGFDAHALCHILHQAYLLGGLGAGRVERQAVADVRRRMYDFGPGCFSSVQEFQQWPIGLLATALAEHPGRDPYYRQYKRVGMIRVAYAVSAAAWVNTAVDERMQYWEGLMQQIEPKQFSSSEIQHIKDVYPGLLQMPGVEEAVRKAVHKMISSSSLPASKRQRT